jgi:DNA repair exonuclease SbcCD ATPase subunit
VVDRGGDSSMINFKTVRFRNFGSFGNTDTEIDLNKHNFVLVSGNNGHGKSFALLDSITFALFGKPFRKINIPQLTNSVNQKDCMTEVEFSIGNDEYKIKRGLKPKIFEIFKDGKLIDQSATSKDYQRMLEEQILKMNYKSFTQVVILGSSSFVPFMQLTAADRRSVIEDILDINVFSLMNGILKTRVLTLKEEERELGYEISIAKEKIDIQNKHIKKLQDKSQESINEIQEDIKTIIGEAQEVTTSMSSIQSQINELKEQITNQDSLSSSLNKINKLKDNIDKNIKTTESNIEFYVDNTNCPTCHQNIQDDHRHEMIDNKKKKIVEYNEGLSQINLKLETLTDELNCITSILSDIAEKEKEFSELNTELSIKKDRIETANKRINSIKSKDTDDTQENERLKELVKELADLDSVKESNTSQMHDYGIVSGLLKDSGIKSKIIKYYLPIMNRLINKYLGSMDFFAQFHLDENFNETIKSRHRDEFSYMSFSEGEKMRIDLALLLSWREVARLKNSANTNLLILDEVFDSSLDSMGTDEFMKLLYNLGKKVNVFIISHRTDQLSDKFEHTITFEKKNNFSRIIRT